MFGIDNPMGGAGQNLYAGQDNGFGGFAQGMDLRQLLGSLMGGGKPTPEGNRGAVDPAQAEYTGARAPDFNSNPSAYIPGMYDAQQLGSMRGATPASSAGIPQPEMPIATPEITKQLMPVVRPRHNLGYTPGSAPQGNFGSVDMNVAGNPYQTSMMNAFNLRNPRSIIPR